ncbi:LysR substrate-binding domain-containing protein [Microbacterium sp. NPDC078428]|uniref:LysR substrate-binding domain-containing protein n=1 Tax=Microbacterium limosum TaxID=3079935 RepID=A0AAU0MFU7_9MICO|nr:LysR substrate-binding domain-containing protein [Microbacterium sp. Y20]WOQ69353.1 LysR substrate-binding domain-containing protein [Microbacterium sp. Y20]
MTRGSGRRARRPARPIERGSRKPPPKAPSPSRPATAREPGSVGDRTGVFRLGVVPGTTPGTWISRWRERLPGVELQLVPVEAREAREILDARSADAVLARLPLQADGLHVIRLYDEVPVVVFDKASHLAAADELRAIDLEGQVRIVPADDVLPGLELPGTVAPSFPSLATTADAIETVAAGVGIVVVPQSLARLHHRRDTDYRPLADGPVSTVALAWIAEQTTPDVEAFVGIVRGRTARSSRA